VIRYRGATAPQWDWDRPWPFSRAGKGDRRQPRAAWQLFGLGPPIWTIGSPLGEGRSD